MSSYIVGSNRLDGVTRMKRNVPVLVLAAIVACAGIGAQARAVVTLGTAGSYAVLGGSTVTSTGPSVLVGDLGVSPGTAITGFFGTVENDGPGTFSGASHEGDAAAALAQVDAATAYGVLAALPFAPGIYPLGNNLTGQNLGGLTLTPGVYHFDSSAQLTGTLTLDGLGQTNPQFVFQIGSTLTTASASSITMTNGAGPCNVYWQVGSSATLGTDTSFAGTIIALASDSLNTGANVKGRVIALTGAVTLQTNQITSCVVPEPTTVVLLVSGLTSLLVRTKRARAVV